MHFVTLRLALISTNIRADVATEPDLFKGGKMKQTRGAQSIMVWYYGM